MIKSYYKKSDKLCKYCQFSLEPLMRIRAKAVEMECWKQYYSPAYHKGYHRGPQYILTNKCSQRKACWWCNGHHVSGIRVEITYESVL